jgi:tryptophanyl-tRNA synthetase
VTRVFSGIQPSGTTHLGNYLGALVNWVEMQHESDAIYCIVDLHALTLPKEPGEIHRGTIEMARTLLAVGIDPSVSTLFVQSHIREHNELCWVMQTVSAFGELGRMTQFKDKSERSGFVSSALFTYPALQAADILLYDTDVVPVGDDQRQHLEFTRDIAARFNSRYGETLVIPEHRISKAGARVMDLQNPQNKMSKSLDSPAGTVNLTDTPAQTEKKFKRAVTDNDSEVRYDVENKPGVSNLLSILGAVTERDPVDLAGDYTQYGRLKVDTAEAVVEHLRPIQQRYAVLDDEIVRAHLKAGAGKAASVAVPVMSRVRDAVGLFA